MDTAATDQDLLKRYVKRGDVTAFELLLDRHQAELLRIAAGFVCDIHAAQDLVQETLIALAKEAEHLVGRRGRHDDGSIRGWLLRVVRNAAIDRARAEARRRSVGDAMEAEVPGVDQVLDDEAALLWAAVDALPPLQRAAVVLRYRDDLSYRAVGEALGKSVSHVGVLLHEAMATLRERRVLREEMQP